MLVTLFFLPSLYQAALTPWTTGGKTSGKYRNLFVELGYPEAEVSSKLQEIYDGLFSGSHKVYFEVDSTHAYITDLGNNDVRTEGMSYGLMTSVQFDHQQIFDKIWNWATKYMQHHSGNYEGYFAWSCSTGGSQNSEGPASDGELYFITALLFAHNRWGSGGTVNYLKEAQYILDQANSKTGQGGVTNLIDSQRHIITFTANSYGSGFTDPSYNVPAFYEVWAEYANDGRAATYRECASAARQFLHTTVHPVTGLTPDYANYDGSPHAMSGQKIGEAFRYDSWRVPMNVALDFSWSHADADWQTEYGEKIQNFLYKEGVKTFLDQYNIDGSKASQSDDAGHSLGLVATSAAVSLVVRHDKAAEFVEQFYQAKAETGDYYYSAFLRLFSFMHLSGNYKWIAPK
jgi:oligosaccharide reducing-end xylanase